MRMRLLLASVALVIIVNAVVLSNVALNRNGEPDATVTLTERELGVGWRGLTSKEDSGIALTLEFDHNSGSYEWFDEEELRTLGFELADLPEGSYKHPLSRRAYVALELAGPRWEALLREQEQQVAKTKNQIASGQSDKDDLQREERELSRMRISDSRLVAVDVSRDAALLRAKYPDCHQYLITAAEVSYNTERDEAGTTHHKGNIVRVLTSPVNIPARFHAVLKQAVAAGENSRSPSDDYWRRQPRYEVTLNYGARLEPWVVNVSALPVEPVAPH